jgi:site-specific recombinase XerD
LDEITPNDIREFLNTFDNLSKKTVLNCHIGLSSFFRCAEEDELCSVNIMRRVRRPRPEKRVIQPLSEEEAKRLLEFVGKSKEYSRPGKRTCSHTTQCYYRNRAILLLLLDTGIRASELCGIRFKDINNRIIKVFGKGDKERLVPISSVTYEAILIYIEKERLERHSFEEFVFVSQSGGKIRTDNLYHMCSRIGDRIGVHVNPHKFRHTFAINFLRNGGNIYALQMILGHSSLEMVKRYLAIADSDIEKIHLTASPVMCWEISNPIN